MSPGGLGPGQAVRGGSGLGSRLRGPLSPYRGHPCPGVRRYHGDEGRPRQSSGEEGAVRRGPAPSLPAPQDIRQGGLGPLGGPEVEGASLS